MLTLLTVLILNNTSALSKEECRIEYPCDCTENTPEEEIVDTNINLNELVKEENVSLITIFIDRQNNITVLYKAEEFVSNTEDIKKIQNQDIENISIEKEDITKEAWETKNVSLAKEAFKLEELNRDYIKFRYTSDEGNTQNLWERILGIFT